MAKLNNRKKAQIVSLFIVSALTIAGFTVFLYRNEIKNALNRHNAEVIKDAGWESNLDYGEVNISEETPTKIENRVLYTTKDELGNGYDVYNVNSIYSTLPLFSSSQWDYDVYNDMFAYYYQGDDERYIGIQLVVMPIQNVDYTDLYNFKTASDEKLKNSLIYSYKQQFSVLNLLFDTANNTGHDDEYLKYEPSLSLHSYRNQAQYIDKYLQVQYFFEKTKAYIIYGIGDKQQSKYIDVFLNTIRKNCKALDTVPRELPYLNKNEMIGEIEIQLPNDSLYIQNGNSILGKLSNDPKSELYNICFASALINEETDTDTLAQEEKNIINRLYIYKMFPVTMYEQALSSVDISKINYILIDSNEDNRVIQITSQSICGIYEPIYVYTKINKLSSGKNRENFIISANSYQLAKDCLSILN